jgi:hypothetical protein
VGHDVVRFVVDREDDHRERPFAVVTAVITSITPVKETSKVIVQETHNGDGLPTTCGTAG